MVDQVALSGIATPPNTPAPGPSFTPPQPAAAPKPEAAPPAATWTPTTPSTEDPPAPKAGEAAPIPGIGTPAGGGLAGGIVATPEDISTLLTFGAAVPEKPADKPYIAEIYPSAQKKDMPENYKTTVSRLTYDEIKKYKEMSGKDLIETFEKEGKISFKGAHGQDIKAGMISVAERSKLFRDSLITGAAVDKTYEIIGDTRPELKKRDDINWGSEEFKNDNEWAAFANKDAGKQKMKQLSLSSTLKGYQERTQDNATTSKTGQSSMNSGMRP